MPLIASLPRFGRAAPAVPAPWIPEIEDALVRRSVDALHAGRATCRHCHRTPLVGEEVYRYGTDLVCELCRPLRRGAPDGTALVRSPEHARVVRPCARRAA